MSLVCKPWGRWWKTLTDILRVLVFVFLIINNFLSKRTFFGIYTRHKYLHRALTPSDLCPLLSPRLPTHFKILLLPSPWLFRLLATTLETLSTCSSGNSLQTNETTFAHWENLPSPLPFRVISEWSYRAAVIHFHPVPAYLADLLMCKLHLNFFIFCQLVIRYSHDELRERRPSNMSWC